MLALRNNALVIAVVSLFVQLPLALGAGGGTLHQRFRGAVALRMLFFLPYVLAEIATGLIFSFVVRWRITGWSRRCGRVFGSDDAAAPAGQPAWTSMPAILVVVVWKYFGFHMMLFIAARAGFGPKPGRGQRSIDGAAIASQVLRHVVHPQLCIHRSGSPVFFAIVGSLQLFDVVMPLTGGGPSRFVADAGDIPLQNSASPERASGFGSAVGVHAVPDLRRVRARPTNAPGAAG